MNRVWLAQIASVMRLELRKSFFARRGLWIYLLALGPAMLWSVHAVNETHNRARLAEIAKTHRSDTAALQSIERGMTADEVESKAGQPYQTMDFSRRRGQEVSVQRYTDGDSDYSFTIVDGQVRGVNERDTCNLPKDSAIFATVFQFFYLRLAVFFGCVGIFTNLFRGEMLDKSLHFYLLAPMRREVLLAGKYLTGLLAAAVIFTTGTALQIAALSWHFQPGQVQTFLSNGGWSTIASYLGVTALACAGYGSIFLAAGLLFKNPIIPATAVLLWESINLFLPAALKKISVIFYLQSLCPTVAAPESDVPQLLRVLISSAEPPPAWLSLAGLTLVVAVLLAVAAWRVRLIEINYGTE